MKKFCLCKINYSNLLLITLFWFLYTGCSSFVDSDGSTEAPEGNRFTHEVIVDGLDEPLQIEFDQQGYVYWIERTGAVKRVREDTGRVELLGRVPLYSGSAPGLIGLLLDKDYDQTGQIYLYYSAPDGHGEHMRLSRFTLGEDQTIDMESEVLLLRVPWRQPDGSHMGGGMNWDTDGNLLLSVGDGTAPSEFEPIHHRDDGTIQDAAGTAGNSNDLRGTILRITPQADGSYTIPPGNLFADATPQTRPEIYIMGGRNPWRLSIDSQTGYLHWGDVGPDAGADSQVYGPAGIDEFNVARTAGNFGWPFVHGSRAYNRYHYDTDTYGAPHDPEAPVNESPNNTGLRILPPAQPALIAYPYGVSEEWPVLGSAGRSAVGGPVFRRADFAGDAPRVFPAYYEGKWLVTDYVRNWIMVIAMNKERTDVLDIEPLLPAGMLHHNQPLDMDFGPTGDLYLVEYGRNNQGRISKYKYNAGNRPPIAQAGAEKTSGALPFKIQLSSAGTLDYDGDELRYMWTVRPVEGGPPQQFIQANPEVTLEQPGRYLVDLTVTDPDGETNSDSFEVVTGNERPQVALEITRGNRSFYFPGGAIEYNVQVSDHEDGSLADGQIDPERVSLTAEYIPSGMTPSQLGELQADGVIESGTALSHVQARMLINQYHCRTCHDPASASVGPSFTEIAQRYEGTEAADTLLQSVTEGSTGKWGEVPMPPNPTVSEAEVRQIVNYILSFAQPETDPEQLPLQAIFTTTAYETNGGGGRIGRFYTIPYQRGSYILHASYTDSGSEETPGLELTGEETVLLRYPLLAPEEADIFSEEGISFTPSTSDPGFIVSGQEPYIGYSQIDLSNINQISIGALTRFWHWSHFIGAMVEVRLDAPDGRLVDEPKPQFRPDSIKPEDGPFFNDNWDPPVEVDISHINGIHDVYIVFRNTEAKTEDALLTVTGIEFKQ